MQIISTMKNAALAVAVLGSTSFASPIELAARQTVVGSGITYVSAGQCGGGENQFAGIFAKGWDLSVVGGVQSQCTTFNNRLKAHCGLGITSYKCNVSGGSIGMSFLTSDFCQETDITNSIMDVFGFHIPCDYASPPVDLGDVVTEIIAGTFEGGQEAAAP